MPETTTPFRVVVSNYAYSNLEEIFHYIAFTDYKPHVASDVIDAIITRIFEHIPDHPYYYPECAARRTRKKMYRQASCKNYKIIFRIHERIIFVIAIVHGSRGTSFIKKIPVSS